MTEGRPAGEGVARAAGSERRSSWEAVLRARTWLSADHFELEIERPDEFAFLSGQHIRILAPEGERDYSLVSGPADPLLRIYVRQVRGGEVSTFLAEARPGIRLAFRGPFGHFVLHPSPRPRLWAASGTGIAPFVSMARAGASGHLLLHGVRRIERLHYAEFLAPGAAAYVACLSEDERSGVPPHAGIEVFHGRVSDYLAGRLAAGRYDFYLCGSATMIREATAIIDARFPDSLVFSEVFF